MAVGGEGSKCTCGSEEAHRQFVLSMDESFKKDAYRRASAPTSETMRAKRLAATNGHSDSIKV